MTELVYAGAFLFHVGLVAILLVGLHRRNASIALNALVSLVAASLPTLLEVTAAQRLALGPELSLWIATAGFLHSLGMVGLYESTWWWDHLTHTLSAALLAALVYAAAVVVAGASTGPLLGNAAVVTVLFVFVAGVFWELLELLGRLFAERLDVTPILIPYGRLDTALDLVFDVVGALLVVTFDVRLFVSVAERYPSVAETLLFTSGSIIAVTSLLMALFVGLVGDVSQLLEAD